MKSLAFALIAFAVMGLATWAYHQNYQTQAALKQTELVQRDIARLRERVTVLRAEWAYLNRPERLRDLADLNFDRLGLFALAPEQFGTVAEVPHPGLKSDAVTGVYDVRGNLEDQE
ncbi:MAG: cell division protein FtsL [Pseudomonadota bacterium]